MTTMSKGLFLPIILNMSVILVPSLAFCWEGSIRFSWQKKNIASWDARKRTELTTAMIP